jgi:(E)-4-hydroxy-3-methylbut-2-enyl-diphosphate synthase
MIAANRLMVARMLKEGMDYPLHLGVTEAGEGEDGRIRSALGIGVLLDEGIGDTIRVSLTEDPVGEIPFARRLIGRYSNERKRPSAEKKEPPFYPFNTNPIRRHETVKVVGNSYLGDAKQKPDMIRGEDKSLIDITDDSGKIYSYTENQSEQAGSDYLLMSSEGRSSLSYFRQKIRQVHAINEGKPVILYKLLGKEDYDDALIEATIDLGGILVEGEAAGIWLESKSLGETETLDLMFRILQATGRRITKAEFIACPSCGRTKFDIQKVLRKVKQRTSHLTGLKIAVMGCIVNGPGEMAGADYGYVGSGNQKVSLFRGPKVILKNINEEEAIEKLINLIREDGRWIDP